ncbi:ABC transporter substrate-binding protein [Paenibacillus ginsengarvi]|uniref:Extracellular solute-binding protein n=1 Tax=Paenibacillus ginsengarvi TaxID=400777 RepID=A0A3B0BCL5_9BACL|nr:extracellular solute-binding protein [Paenibacillus ginsengarvi]RKN70114.1 extracellular solute-binding protein [Paenibacillus ginsengarvi]
MFKKWVSVTASVMLVFVTAACSGGNSEPKTADKPGDASAPKKDDIAAKIAEATSKPVTINVFENSNAYSQEQFMDLYGSKIQKKYPNMSFKLYNNNKDKGGGSIPELLAAGVSLDLVKVSGASFYSLMADNKLESNVADLVKLYGYDMNKLYPAIREQMEGFGKNKEIYGIPNATVSVALFYNKDLFDKFGVAYPKDGMTWDDIYDIAKKMTRQDGGVQYMGFQEGYGHLFPVNQLSQGFIDTKTNKATLNNDNWKKMIDNLARFHTIPGNAFVDYNDPFWKEGKVAMVAAQSAGSWAFADTTPINWDLVELPRFKDAPKAGAGLQLPFYAIASTSKNRDQAFLAAAYIGSEEFQKEFAKQGYVPPIKIDGLMDVFGKGIPKLAGKNLKAAVPLESAASPYPFNSYMSLVPSFLYTAYTDVVTGKKDTNTALRDAEEAANKKVEEALAAKK